MTAPERIYLQDAGDYDVAIEFELTWCVEYQDPADTEYVRADLAAVQPAQVQPDPRDEVIARLVDAATDAAEAIDMAYGSDDDESPHRHSAKLRAALAALRAGGDG